MEEHLNGEEVEDNENDLNDDNELNDGCKDEEVKDVEEVKVKPKYEPVNNLRGKWGRPKGSTSKSSRGLTIDKRLTILSKIALDPKCKPLERISAVNLITQLLNDKIRDTQVVPETILSFTNIRDEDKLLKKLMDKVDKIDNGKTSENAENRVENEAGNENNGEINLNTDILASERPVNDGKEKEKEENNTFPTFVTPENTSKSPVNRPVSEDFEFEFGNDDDDDF